MTTFNIKNAVPIMVSDAGELVCIPRTPDPPTISWVGRKRSGKSVSMNGFCGRSYKTYLNDNFIVANDYMNESPYWLEKQEFKGFLKLLKAIGDKPTKIPYVPVYPNHKELNIDKNLPVYYKFGLPFEDFIKNIENLFVVGRSLVYFKNLIPKILALKNPNMEDINKIFDEAIKSKKMPKESAGMLTSMINHFFEDKRLDLEEGTLGNVLLKTGSRKEGVYDLISGLAYARRIPVFMTGSMVKSENYMHSYFSHILRNIFKNQLSDYSFREGEGKVLNVYVDELSMLTDKDRKTPCTQILTEFVVQGGPARIGFNYATQNPSKLPKKIKTNTKYNICFSLDKSEVKHVNEITPFSKKEIKDITRLKKFEVIANTIDEEWLFVDPMKKTNNCYKASGVVRGKIIPPLSSTPKPIGGIN